MSDRYMKVVSTLIALELLWLSLGSWSRPVSAQPSAMPVVITGIRMDPEAHHPLPVVVEGSVFITADGPLPVKAVPYTPADRPGD